MKIPFNKPFLAGNELKYIEGAIHLGKISGDGFFSKKCHKFFEERYGYKKVLLTSSCTDALEMTAILADIQPGDEVIIPSFTFVSTANAFALRGAKIVFADSEAKTPNIDAGKIEDLITSKTKAIVVVHYAGIACDMDKIMEIANRYNLIVIEDAAHAIDSCYKGRALGSIGHLATFSFHETKNIICGEGGLIIINDPKLVYRAEIIREKGTNRTAFSRGEVDKYQWIDIGSSFLPSDIIAAFLYAQLENLDKIQDKRKKLWKKYYDLLKTLHHKGLFKIPHIPSYAAQNGHLFYIVCRNFDEREALITHLKNHNILALFHYFPLHNSPYYKQKHDGRKLFNSELYSNCLLRLPLYFDLKEEEVELIAEKINEFYSKKIKPKRYATKAQSV